MNLSEAARGERRRGQTLARVQRELGAWPPRDVTQMVRMCLAPRLDADTLSSLIFRAGLAAPEEANSSKDSGVQETVSTGHSRDSMQSKAASAASM